MTRRGEAAVVACLCVLASVVCEGMARLIQPPVPYQRMPQVRYLPHPVRSFTLQPCQSGVYSLSATVDIDCDGFRTNGRIGGLNGKPLILALGDSFTFGLGVESRETWPARLESILRERGCPGARVLNAGTVSYGVFQEDDLLVEYLGRIHPDAVIHGLYWNDYQSAHPPRPGASSVLTREGVFIWDDNMRESRMRAATRWLVGHSSLAALAHRAGRKWSTEGEGQSGDQYAMAYARFIRGQLDPALLAPVWSFYGRFQLLAREHGFSAYVIIVPSVNVLDHDTALQNPYRRLVTEHLDGLNLPYVDGYALWKDLHLGPRTFLPQGADAHLSASGYEVLAGTVARRLLEDRLPGC